MLDTLNEKFAIDGHLKFVEEPSGFVFAEINNAHAKATIALHGAHVTSFQPHDEKPVIWTSPAAIYKQGKAIRGGIPICWPWFGAHPSDTTKPSHGFARNRNWQIIHTETITEPNQKDGTKIIFQLTNTEETQKLWAHPFNVTLTICIGSKLTLSLTTTNSGDTNLEVGGALHSYFAVGNITNLAITGLEATTYLDALDGMSAHTQNGAIEFTAGIDRVYTNTTAITQIHDNSNNRIIKIEKSGSNSTVVWNPWKEISTQMADLENNSYKEMVCVETTNALKDIYTLAPSESHSLETTIYTKAK